MTACDSTMSNAAIAKRQRHAVGQGEVQVAAARARAPSRTPASRNAVDRIDADDEVRLFGERQRHAAAAAAGVEHAAARSATPARSRNAMTFALR